MLRPRYFLQHIGGDPITLRYLARDTFDPETGAAQWTEHPSERHEWETKAEAQTVRDILQRGLVLPTFDPDRGQDPDTNGTTRRAQHHHPEPSEPIPDDQLPWWQR